MYSFSSSSSTAAAENNLKILCSDVSSSSHDSEQSVESSPQKQQVATCNKRQKLFLQRSLASRTISFVETEIESLTSKCHFLKENTITCKIAKLERSEIVVGELLGEGGFSQVHTVKKFDFITEEEDDDDDDVVAVVS